MNIENYIFGLNLKNLKIDGGNASFVCPICGGSQSNPNRRQAFILGLTTEHPSFYCHRRQCQLQPNNSFANLLKRLDSSLYHQFIAEKQRERLDVFGFSQGEKEKPKTIAITSVDKRGVGIFDRYLDSCDKLPQSHEAVKYLTQRKIDIQHWSGLYYFTGDVYGFYSKVVSSEKYKTRSNNVSGIVIPFVGKDQVVKGLCIRTFNNYKTRFINLIEDGYGFVLGENRISDTEDLYLVEGVFDKFSVDDNNWVAMLSTNPKTDYVRTLTSGRLIYIYDNEYNNPAIKKNIDALKHEYVFLWDSSFPEAKDLNDLKTIYGLSSSEIKTYINKNIYSGLELEIKSKGIFDNFFARSCYV